ncbi:PIG-P [Dendrothele bispora CBS 962.96]|uniref:PIG-P n=1 Tax=Dendrothele bispora (strain CBS 962.96) TaxID=1314807 RepID=A0A4V4HGK0_DENBC|nr:PIG-P [Dendrothele bispora CBS 962.96]
MRWIVCHIPTSPTSPLASFPSSPPEYKSRAPEFYGFVAWTSTSFLFVIYVLWALLPDEYIVSLGIDWYPNREWTILFPAWSIIVVLLTYFVYFALTLYGTPPLNHTSTISDSRAQFPKLSCKENEDQTSALLSAYAPYAKQDTTPELYDIPIGMVNHVLYGIKKEELREKRG